jgi:hypothetical protein
MSENQTSLQLQGLIKSNFIPTKENISDLGRKNVSKEVYQEHESKFLKDQDSNQDQKTQQECQDTL